MAEVVSDKSDYVVQLVFLVGGAHDFLEVFAAFKWLLGPEKTLTIFFFIVLVFATWCRAGQTGELHGAERAQWGVT